MSIIDPGAPITGGPIGGIIIDPTPAPPGEEVPIPPLPVTRLRCTMEIDLFCTCTLVNEGVTP